LPMISRIFLKFSILSHVVLLFPKHSNSMVFWCNSRRNHTNRQSKTFDDLWRLWEDREWRLKMPQKILQRVELCSQVLRHLLLKKNQNRRRNRCYARENTMGASCMIHVLQAWTMWEKIQLGSPKCEPSAPSVAKIQLANNINTKDKRHTKHLCEGEKNTRRGVELC